MDAVKFLEEYKRMCEFYPTCEACPIRDAKPALMTCDVYMSESPYAFVSVVEKWSAEHPVKTRLIDFLEKYPNAALVGKDNLPYVRPIVLGYCGKNADFLTCKGCEHHHYNKTLYDCWNLPLEE